MILESLKKIRNYFGTHDRTHFEHWAYAFLDRFIKGKQDQEEELFKIAEELADEAFGKHGVEKYSERQELTVKFNEILSAKGYRILS